MRITKDILRRLCSDLRAEYEQLMIELETCSVNERNILLSKIQVYDEVIDKLEELLK